MAIPDFQSIMVPVLKLLSDGRTCSNQEIYEFMSRFFNLSEQEINLLLPSGRQRVFTNRVAWAKSHLKQAWLVESPARGMYKITERGKLVLASGIDRLTIKDLMKYPEFAQFRNGKAKSEPAEGFNACQQERTPEEYIELGYNKMLDEISYLLLDNIRNSSPYLFEKIVLDLVISMGYGGTRKDAGVLTRKGSDEGIDGIINEDKLGLDVIYIQAKRWAAQVGRPEIQKFAGALLGKKAKKGIFLTTSTFTREAREFAGSIDAKIVLIDGNRLAELMIEYNVGVAVAEKYEIKRVDSDYFLEEQ